MALIKLPDRLQKFTPLIIGVLFHLIVLLVLGGVYMISPTVHEELFNVRLIQPRRTPFKKIERELKPPEMTQMEVKTLEERVTKVSEVDRLPDTVDEKVLEFADVSDEPIAPKVERKTQEVTRPKLIAVERFSGGLKGSVYSGRGERGLMSRRFGGSAGSEKAVNKGLEYLARHQEKDGSWLTPKRGKCVGVSGLALMAFLGAGHSTTAGDIYAETVRKAIKFIKESEKDGYLVNTVDPVDTGQMYSHALGTLALVETYSMGMRTGLNSTIERAVDKILNAQTIVKEQSFKGGWRYNPGDMDSDLSVTGWVTMALVSAQRAGFKVPDKALTRAGLFVKRCSSSGGFAYQPGAGPNAAMTAAGSLCLQFCGYADEPSVQAGIQFIDNRLPVWGADGGFYYWYYATQVAFQKGGPVWERWNARMRDLLIEKQNLDGSWDESSGNWDPEGGKIFTTAAAVLILEVYYRYLPIYREVEYRAAEPLVEMEEGENK